MLILPLKQPLSKFCSKCETEKSADQFFKNRSRIDGLASYCRPCMCVYQRKWVKANPGKSYYTGKEYLAKWRSENRIPRGKPGSVRYEAKMAGFRSGFERTIDYQLKASGLEYQYEPTKIPYRLEYNYIPDFYIPSKDIYIEVKGYLRREDQAKLRAVKAQHPELDIRLVFIEADKKVPYSKSTHGQWADRQGFPYADKEIPAEWFK